jgi:hypothetical protein
MPSSGWASSASAEALLILSNTTISAEFSTAVVAPVDQLRRPRRHHVEAIAERGKWIANIMGRKRAIHTEFQQPLRQRDAARDAVPRWPDC